MKVSFGDKTIVTTVYVKLVAPDKLLLSETVCRLLGIVSYHPNVQSVERCQPEKRNLSGMNHSHVAVEEGEKCKLTDDRTLPPVEDILSDNNRQPVKDLQPGEQPPKLVKQSGENIISSARVRLVSTVRLPANHAAAVPVKIHEIRGTAMIEAENFMDDCVHIDQSLVEVNKDGLTTLIIVNNGKSPCRLESSMELVKACEADAELLNENDQTQEVTSCTELAGVFSREYDETLGPPLGQFKVCSVSSSSNVSDSNEHVQWRQHQLRKAFVESRKRLSQEEALQLSHLLADYYDIFSLNDDERGETDLVEFKIDTGDTSPKKQAARRVPFAARQAIARQLDEMQSNNIIKPSESPWASPVVLVKKRDGTLRFCVDYRALNSVTKPDVFPLPRIYDLLDQLGKLKYFTTLDLKSGYWQIKVQTDSQEKTAFITHEGLFKFRVMPFGVKNAPAIFQRLMRQVLSGLQSESGIGFVSVYLDDVIVFSESLIDHINHLKAVFNR